MNQASPMSELLTEFQYSNERSELSDFRRALSAIANLAVNENIPILAFKDESLPHFRNLSFEKQKETLQVVNIYAEVMAELKRDEGFVLRNSNSLWRMLGRLRLKVSDGFYSHLGDDDVVELYDLEGRQLYRSFNFFPLCTCTLEELYTIPWFELYERDEKVGATYHQSVERLVENPELGVRPTAAPTHIVKERLGLARRESICVPGCMAPVFDFKGQLFGLVNTFSARARFT
jgi:hypothetical protein